MKNILLAGLVLLAAGCRKSETAKGDSVPTRAIVAGARLIEFDEQTGAFTCLAPADWKAMEDKETGGPLVMFFGPLEGPRRGQVVISVSRYPNGADRIKTPQDYRDALKITGQAPSPLEKKILNGRAVYTLHHRSPQRRSGGREVLYMNREDSVMIPYKGGFFEVNHSAPALSYQDTLPLFEALVESFRISN